MHERPSSVSPAKRAAGPIAPRDVAVDRAMPRPAHLTRPAACALCGDPLPGAGPSCRVVSPYCGGKLLVCRACRRVALAEGYLPAA